MARRLQVDDLEIGLVVTCLGHRPTIVTVATQESDDCKSTYVQKSYSNFNIGEPMQILAINYPFINVHIFSQNKPHIFDCRQTIFASVTKDFIRTCKIPLEV